MKLYSLETGNFMLDGGAMFGVVPDLSGIKCIHPMRITCVISRYVVC
jgi:hypothetical protein